MKKRNCPYCNVTSFRFKRKEIKFICAKCHGVVYNHYNQKVEEIKK
jgi:Zn-finger nucleic acid-binding protein